MIVRNNGVNQIWTITWSSKNHKTLDGLDLLAMEIVKLAAQDYRRELIRSKKGNLKTRECYQLERFFRSEYGQLLSMGKAEYIMEKIQEEVEEIFHDKQ
jgi:hypothetical protein